MMEEAGGEVIVTQCVMWKADHRTESLGENRDFRIALKVRNNRRMNGSTELSSTLLGRQNGNVKQPALLFEDWMKWNRHN